MKNARELFTFLRDKRKITKADVLVALDVKPDTLRMAIINNRLTASWYDVLEQFAGRKLPRDYFTFVKRKDE